MEINEIQQNYIKNSQIMHASSNALEHTLNRVGKETTNEELMDACKEFEAYFMEQLYKGMEKTIIKADEKEDVTSQYKNFFGDMQIQEYSKIAVNQGEGIGLAAQLYEQMKRNYGL